MPARAGHAPAPAPAARPAGVGLSALPRVLAVEDDPRVSALLATLLAPRAYHLTLAPSAALARESLRAQGVDLALVDLGLPDADGVALISELRGEFPALPVLVVTVASRRARVLAALRAGACGYLLKEDLVPKLETAITEVLAGGMPLSAAAATFVLEQLRGPEQPAKSLLAPLTPREREVLGGIARGLTYAQTGIALGVSENTVRAHIRSTYEKLQTSSKAEAVMIALREGWLPDP